MQQEVMNIINSFNQTALDTTKQLFAINVRTCEKLLEKQTAFTGMCLDNGEKQMGLVREFKDIPGYWTSQGEFVKEYAEKSLAAAKESVEILTDTRDELTSLFEKGVSKVTTDLKVVSAKKAA